MKKLSPERRRVMAAAGASAAISGSSLSLFKNLPHTGFYDSLHGLVVGIPIGITLALLYKMKRRSQCSNAPEGS